MCISRLLYVILHATLITDKKTTSVVNHLFADIMLKWGFPRILHSDSGAEFKSKLMEIISEQLGIKKTFIFPYHPRHMEN